MSFSTNRETKELLRTGLARVGKHATLLFILFFSFFPLWVMLNISQKDNARFYRNPFGVEVPFRTGDWEGVPEMVGGIIREPGKAAETAVLYLLIFGGVGSLLLSGRASILRGLLWVIVSGVLLYPAFSSFSAMDRFLPNGFIEGLPRLVLSLGTALSRPFATLAPSVRENWATAWSIVGTYIANTAVVAISSTVFTLIFALAGAYFFARVRVPLSGFLWFALVFLLMFPAIANLVPLFVLLRRMNLLNTLIALIVVGCSVGQAFAIFVMRGYIEGIPHEMFEAAEVDGASHFWQFRSVVLPLSGPILATVAIFHFIGQWNDFILPLVVLRDEHLWTITVGLMRLDGEYVKQWGVMMAGYAISSLPIVTLFLLTMRLFIRGLTEGAVKG